MIHPSRALVIATLSFFSALSAQAANIKISALPFTITAPGTYVVTRNLTIPTGVNFGISFNISVPGPVVIDLKGFTLTGQGSLTDSYAINIGDAGIVNSYPITIRNGTISNFLNGMSVVALTDVTINNITFNETAISPIQGTVFGISLERTSSCSVSNCTFILTNPGNGFTAIGIKDVLSTGGNSYNNDTFVNITTGLSVGTNQEDDTLTLSHCQFAPPPTN